MGVEEEEKGDEGNKFYTEVLHQDKLHYLTEKLLWLDMKEQVDKIYPET